ncbi:hypothetical protein [Cellulomonas sp. URHE0023]|uniref:hypothetical protein n=1 Tax=Cellulomonas sp. URHE0023 TaxID=1380354 RepID=UPI000B1A7185|nr:hypothetical protein [Cellulomonas sp. URHE0023]
MDFVGGDPHALGFVAAGRDAVSSDLAGDAAQVGDDVGYRGVDRQAVVAHWRRMVGAL